jgi:hypothetical protein
MIATRYIPNDICSWPFPFIRTRSGRLNLKAILLNSVQKEWIAKEIVEYGQSIKVMHERFSLSKQTLRRYSKHYKNGGRFLFMNDEEFMSDDEIEEFNYLLLSKDITVGNLSLKALRYEVMSFLLIKRG